MRESDDLVCEPALLLALQPSIAYLIAILVYRQRGGCRMSRLTARDVTFLELQSAVLCIECELISYNNVDQCLACGSSALLTLSRVLGGSLRNGPTATVVPDGVLNRVVDRALGHVEPLSVARQDERYGWGQAAMQAIVEQTYKATEADGAALALWRNDKIVCTARFGIAPPLGAEVSLEYGLSGQCLRTAQTLRCDDAEHNALVDWEACRQLGAYSVVVAPLAHLNHTVGLLQVLSSQTHAFEDRHVAAVQLLANLAVVALLQSSARRRRLNSD